MVVILYKKTFKYRHNMVVILWPCMKPAYDKMLQKNKSRQHGLSPPNALQCLTVHAAADSQCYVNTLLPISYRRQQSLQCLFMIHCITWSNRALPSIPHNLVQHQRIHRMIPPWSGRVLLWAILLPNKTYFKVPLQD